MTKVKLGDYVSLQTHKVDNITAVNTSYVSTENLQPNKNGVLFPAASVPSSGKVNFYDVGDILVSNIRPYFKKIWMAINPGTHSSDVLNFRTKSPKLTQEYLYIVLESDSFFDYVTLTSKGTKMPRGDKDAIMDFEFSLPSLDVQQKISNTILALERKILMSKQVNDNLLDLSMTHFEHWLETTSSTNNVSLDEIATYKNGLAMQKFEPEDGADSLPVLKIRELNQGFTDSSSNRARTDIDESVKVYDGDVIFSWSGTLLVDIWTGGSAGLNQHLFKVTSTAYPKWFYYMWTRYHLRQFQQIAAGKATTMGHIKRGDLKAANVTIPTDSEFPQLETLLKPVVATYIENGVEIKNLQTIRDQLLQKLHTQSELVSLPEWSLLASI